MSEARNAHWTVETLKQHFDQRIADGEKAVSAALAAAEKAVEKAEINADKWRAQANEWRGAMDDREIKFAMRTEMEAEFRAIRASLESLKETRAASGGGARTTDTFRSNLAVFLSAIAIAVLLWRAFTGN